MAKTVSSSTELVRVTVQRADGATFEVAVEKDRRSVAAVKAVIEKVDGLERCYQDLFVLPKELQDPMVTSGVSKCALDDRDEIEDGWTLALLVKDANFTRGGAGATFSGNSRIVTQQNKNRSLSLTNMVAAAAGCTAYAEFKLLSGDSDGLLTGYVGAVVPYTTRNGQHEDLDLDKNHATYSNHEGYFMHLRHGGLFGAWSNETGGGPFTVGDRVGVLVKAGDGGFVRFFRNGSPIGGEFSGLVKSPLVIAAEMVCEGDSLELISNAVPPRYDAGDWLPDAPARVALRAPGEAAMQVVRAEIARMFGDAPAVVHQGRQ